MSFGGIIAVPNGYLASCDIASPGTQGLCSSHDLVAWQSPPAPAMYVNAGGASLLPYGTVPVKSGYGARGALGAGTVAEWYSSDGVNWQEGIPADQIAGPCVPDTASASGCALVSYSVSSPNSPIAFAAVKMASESLPSKVLISRDGWSSWEEAKLPADWTGLVVGQVPQALPDGTWIAVASPSTATDTSGPAVVAEPAGNEAISTTDGTHWKDIHAAEYSAVIGRRIFASCPGAQGHVYESLDSGQSWSEVRDTVDRSVVASGICWKSRDGAGSSAPID